MKNLLALVIILSSISAFAQVPQHISYQGFIRDPATGAIASDGAHTIIFRFYDAKTSGNLKWQTSQIAVTSFKGFFASVIPIPKNAPWNQALFVEMTVDSQITDRILASSFQSCSFIR